MTREVTMTCDACSRVIDGVNSAFAETLRGPSGDDAVDLCDWCVDAVREFLKQKRARDAKPVTVERRRGYQSPSVGPSAPDADDAHLFRESQAAVYANEAFVNKHPHESLNFDAVTAALDQPQDAPVFKPGKPIKPTVMQEPDIEQVSRIMHLERAVDGLRMRSLRLECEVARLEGVIEGMEKGGKVDAEKAALDRRNADVASHLPAGSIVVSLPHPAWDTEATVYLVFGKDPVPYTVVVYGDESLTVAAVADLIRTGVQS